MTLENVDKKSGCVFLSIRAQSKNVVEVNIQWRCGGWGGTLIQLPIGEVDIGDILAGEVKRGRGGVAVVI